MAAANSIFKLRVETSEYDQKLANAAKGIRHLADVAHKGGGELTGLEKAELDYIRGLGEMETKSRSASGQVRELSNTYKELKVVYDQLNEVEKADEGGKALAASLETLKQRAQEAKSQLDSASQSLQSNGEAGKGTSSVMEMLKEKFTVNIDAIKLFNIGLQAAEGALSVAKDAFFASEATVDEWGRVVDSSKSLYQGFLTALNTGDISGYLGRIDEIVQAARTAYNELDRLGTMKTIQGPKMSAQQTENERMRMMIQTGRYIAPVDGRRASMKDGQLLTPEQIRGIETKLQNGMKTVVSLVGNEVKQTGKAIDAVYDRQAKELGLSLKEFRKGTSSMAEFDKRMAGYEQYQKWREQHTTIDIKSGRETVARGNPFEQFAKWGTFRVDGQRYNDLVRLIQQRDQQAGQAYSMQSQAYRTMNRAEGVTVSKLMRGETSGGSSGGGGGSTKATPQERASDKVSEAERTYAETLLKNSIRLEAGIDSTLDNKKKELSAQERLFDAYNDAYATYKDPKYKEASAQAAERIKALAAEVKTATDAQDAAKKAARELEQAQKKLADAQQKLADAQATGSATAIYKAQKEVNRQQDVVNRLQNPSLPVPAKPTGFEAYKQTVQAEITFDQMKVDESTLHTLLQTALQNGLDSLTVDYSGLQERIAQGIDIPDSTWEELQEEINAKLKELGVEPIVINFKTGEVKNQAKEMTKDWNSAAKAIQSVGSAMSQIENPAAKVVGTVAQAIATIALGYAQATTQAASEGPWAWIAFAATGLATMVSTISAIHSATGYAQGGMIKGNSYSGDNIGGMVDGGASGFVGLNAGEVVLNRAQQGNLASQLQYGDGQHGETLARVSGETIYIAVNNYLRRTGQGELVTWR